MRFHEDEVLQILQRLPSECAFIDYKVIPYQKEKIGDFLKDVIAMLNSEECIGTNRYIILGVSDNKHLVGIKAGSQLEDNEYQNWLDKITPRPMVFTGKVDFEEKEYGYIFISKENEIQVYEMKDNVVGSPSDRNACGHQVFAGQAFTRHGSKNYIMFQNDRERLLLRKKTAISDNKRFFESVPTSGVIAYAAMLGGWDAGCSGDNWAVETLFKMECNKVSLELRDANSKHEGLFRHSENKWTILNRDKVLKETAKDIYDVDIQSLQNISIKIIQSADIKSIGRKNSIDSSYTEEKHNYSFSSHFVKSVFEFWAFANNNKLLYKNCNRNTVSNAFYYVLDAFFESKSWEIWKIMSECIPLIAEASPEGFLKKINCNISTTSSSLVTFICNGIENSSYLSDRCICEPLGMLASYKRFFSQAANVLLRLSEYDSRYLDTLVSVMHPLISQVEITPEYRYGFIKASFVERPKLAWGLLIRLLPIDCLNHYVIASPKYMQRPQIISNDCNITDYMQEVNTLFKYAAEEAEDEAGHILELTCLVGNISPDSRAILFELIKNNLDRINQEESYEIWEKLTDYTQREKRCRGQEWALSENEIEKIEGVIELIDAKLPGAFDRKLFRKEQWKLTDNGVDYLLTSEKEIEKQQCSVAAVKYAGGMEILFRFIESIENSEHFGRSLAKVEVSPSDMIQFAGLIIGTNVKLSSFARGYVASLYKSNNQAFLSYLSLLDNPDLIVAIFCALPISSEGMERISVLGEEYSDEYWRKVNPLSASKDEQLNINLVVESLNRVKRVSDSLMVLYYAIEITDRTDLEPRTVFDTLMQTENQDFIKNNQYQIYPLIRFIQSSFLLDEEKIKVEWKYIDILLYGDECQPKNIYLQIAKNPKEFVRLLCMVYKGKNEETDKKGEEAIEQFKAAYSVLFSWNIVPGISTNGTLDEKYLIEWIDEVKKLAEECDRKIVAEEIIGKVLFYAPADPDGFFINRKVAEQLQREDAVNVRRGYMLEVVNSRGAYQVDWTGENEFKLEQEYLAKSEKAEKEGYTRFAVVLREIAEDYHNEAMDNIEEAQKWQKQ